MRRRRPSALYTVLDEEQLLGGVDLTDHPDPLAGRPVADVGDEWDEWSPGDEDDPYEDAGHAWQALDVDIGVGGDIDSQSAPGEADVAGGGRRRWLTIGFVGALVVVLLVAHELGAALDTAGSHSPGLEAAPQPAAPPAALPPARRSSGGSRRLVHPAPEGVGSRVRGGATRRPRPRAPRGPVGPAGRANAPARGPAKPDRGGGPAAPPARRTAARTEGGGVHRAPSAGPSRSPRPSRSPDREFGFER